MRNLSIRGIISLVAAAALLPATTQGQEQPAGHPAAPGQPEGVSTPPQGGGTGATGQGGGTGATGQAGGQSAACSTPSFAFKWIGDGAVQILAKAKPAGRFRVWIEESQRSGPRESPLAVAVNDGQFIFASESGVPYSVDLTGMELLRSAGRARIWYAAETPCAPTTADSHTFRLIDAGFLRTLSRNWLYKTFKATEMPPEETPAQEKLLPPLPLAAKPSGDANAKPIDYREPGRLAAAPAAAAQAITGSAPLSPKTEQGVQQTDGVVVLDQHHLSIDVGPVFVMKNDGSFDTNAELALTSESRWLDMLSGAVDLRLSSLNMPESSTKSPSLSTPNVFEGTARAIFYPGGASWNVPSFGLVLGAGLRSPQSDAMNLQANLLAGFRLQVAGYNAGNPGDSFADTRGFVEIGYTRDRYWRDPNVQTDQRNRLYAEGQLEIPGLGGENVRIMMRVRSSKPMLFDGRSELRISALASINPAVFRTIFGLAK